MKLIKRTITVSYDKQKVNMQAIANAILSLPGTQRVYPECERCEKLVTALKDRMARCSCHFGGLDPDGFADQPCEECDRDRAIINNYKE